ncbi:Transcriptional regulator containing an amidase domain and an AraC-type DNA-binding HTH domain|uniref:Helix-turn-helix protein n=1 Tax=Brenneria salicis ATCC 15712 = DSM 30166 TaxID=714314 RepID=A0A366HYM9_9GAMM|nr:AraC family transcriptional regulator [Brenneria salicis]NMN90263.1 Transcriptional regulator containing an amidase domain and an AraC-type DNA-binding HTH domain [Brenneria salicis ATCC 15712 = DSM 30166]RBP58769.1 helix-turn-helix protein [Brenneria salicis ATCC 15712 = DSM 30166]RLM31159.1 hypothetical protein BHG07_06470 [Brenneria salicis ATCC 15712 = DSM 30166]
MLPAYSNQPFKKITFNADLQQWESLLHVEYGLISHFAPSKVFNSHIRIKRNNIISIAHVCTDPIYLSVNDENVRDDALLFKIVLDGNVFIEEKHDIKKYPPGSILAVDPGSDFIEYFNDDTQLIVIRCLKKNLQNHLLNKRYDLLSEIDPQSSDAMLVKNIIMLAAQPDINLNNTLSLTLSHTIITMLDELAASIMPKSTNKESLANLTLIRVKQFIHKNLSDETLDAKKIADGVKLSINYPNRLFKNENTSLMRYVWTQRVILANTLLNDHHSSHMSIGEIAWQCGFVSQSHFCYLYKKHYDRNASQYRSREKINPA